MKLLDDQGLEALLGGAMMADKDPAPVTAPEDKRPSLSLEELEAKQGINIQKKISLQTQTLIMHSFSQANIDIVKR